MNQTTNTFRPTNKYRTASAIVADLEQRVKDHCPASDSVTDYISQHLYFVTLLNRSPVMRQIDEFSIIYFKTCADLLGSRIQTKRDRQPFGYAFMDFENSRTSALPMAHWTLPHVHAVLLSHPSINDEFASTFKGNASVRPGFKSIDIQKFDPSKNSLIGLLTYCMKGYCRIPESSTGHDIAWQVFPK